MFFMKSQVQSSLSEFKSKKNLRGLKLFVRIIPRSALYESSNSRLKNIPSWTSVEVLKINFLKLPIIMLDSGWTSLFLSN